MNTVWIGLIASTGVHVVAGLSTTAEAAAAANIETAPQEAKTEAGSYFGWKSAVGIPLLAGYLYFVSPTVFREWITNERSFDHLVPLSEPVDIVNVREVTGVHTWKDLEAHDSEDVVIFRNFTDCASKFDNVLYPKHKDWEDVYTVIEEYNADDERGNAFARGFKVGDHPITKSLETIIEEQSPYHYASFLSLFDKDDYRFILNADPDVEFGMDTSFISHFKHATVSTPIHSATLAKTYSLQCHGTKGWLFWNGKVLDEYGFDTVYYPSGGILKGSPESILRIPTLRAVVGPNDLIVFPSHWYHAVASTPGKNVMFAIRKLTILQSIAYEPYKTLRAISWTTRERGPSILTWAAKKILPDLGFGKDNGYRVARKSNLPFKDSYMDLILDVHQELFGKLDHLDYFGLPEDSSKHTEADDGIIHL